MSVPLVLLLPVALASPSAPGGAMPAFDPLGQVTTETVELAGPARVSAGRMPDATVVGLVVRYCHVREVAFRPDPPAWPFVTTVDLRIQPDGHVSHVRLSGGPAPLHACVVGALARRSFDAGDAVTTEAVRVTLSAPPPTAVTSVLDAAAHLTALSGPARQDALGADLADIVASRVAACHAEAVAQDPTLAALPYTVPVGLHVTEAGVVDAVTPPPGALGACLGPRVQAVTLTPGDAPTTLTVEVTVRLSERPPPALLGPLPY